MCTTEKKGLVDAMGSLFIKLGSYNLIKMELRSPLCFI
jgi:hypothetical protein